MDFLWSFFFLWEMPRNGNVIKYPACIGMWQGPRVVNRLPPRKYTLVDTYNTFQNISWYQDSLALAILGSNFLLVIVPPKMCRRNIFCKRPFAILLVPKRRPAMCHWHVSARCQLFMCPFIATIFSFPFICVIISHLFWFTAFASQYNVYCGRGRASLQVWPLTQ